MENIVRTQRTRDAAIQAALKIVARDGPTRLTIDAIARESGISKGGILHHFRTKNDVVKALMEHEREYYREFRRKHLAEIAIEQTEPHLATEIEISRTLLTDPNSAAFAIMGTLSEEPGFLDDVRKQTAEHIELMRGEAPDPDLALLRWAAARGLALMSLFRFNPLSEEDMDRLFERLLDNRQWSCSREAGGQEPR